MTGPVIAGPHQTPFVCETEAFGLGPALDGNCSVSTRVDYFYRVRAPASPQLESPAASSAAALARLERPAALQLWWRMPGRLATLDPVTDPSRCQVMFPVAANPRLVAGSPPTQDKLKCELKALDRADYRVPFTDAQFAGLREVFPGGVCDYNRPGVGQRPPQTWLSYPRQGDAERLARTQP